MAFVPSNIQNRLYSRGQPRQNWWCNNEEIQAFEDKVLSIAEGMSVRINYVDDIPSTKKGKRAFIINEDKDLLDKWRVKQS